MSTLEADFVGEGSNRWQTLAAYREMQLHAAKQVGAHFVFSDMGPHAGVVNRVLATSADVIQSCACADSYSWSGAVKLIIDVLPKWMEWWAKVKQAEPLHSQHKYNKNFPRIMPFLATQVGACIL